MGWLSGRLVLDVWLLVTLVTCPKPLMNRFAQILSQRSEVVRVPVKLLAIARLFSFQTLSGSQTWDGGSLSRTVDLGSVDCSAEPPLHNGWGRLRTHRPFTRNSKSKIKFQPIKVPPARAADRNPKKEIWEIRNAHPGSKLEASTTSTEMLTLEPISWKRSQFLSKTRLTIKLLQSFF